MSGERGGKAMAKAWKKNLHMLAFHGDFHMLVYSRVICFFSLLWNIGFRSDEASIFMGLGMAADPRKLEKSATEDGKFSNKKWGLDVQDPGSSCYRCLVPQVEKLRKENKAIKEKVRTGLQARNYCLAFPSRARGFFCAHFLNAMCFW